MHPLPVVSLATLTYSAVFTILQRVQPRNHNDYNLNHLHDAHSILTTAASLYALSQDWPLTVKRDATSSTTTFLNDQQNPLIFGKSQLGNFITSWETSYLLFDTFAKLDSTLPLHRRLLDLARQRPLTLFHHLALLSALGVLQVYIARDRERGVWIIVALMLMNASTPILHWRWRQKKQNGKTTLAADALLIVVFAACRMGLPRWVLRQYGKFHGIGPWEALDAQRSVCKIGTGVLVGVNAIWWLILVRNVVMKVQRRLRCKAA